MRRFILGLFAVVFCAQLWAVDPSVTLTSYYAGIDGKATNSSDDLRKELCTIISTGYTSIGYSSLPNSVYAASSDPSDFYNGSSKTMEDIYSSKAYVSGDAKSSATDCGQGWNKEHTVPQSWFNEASPMKSDAHHVFPTDIKMNSLRSSYPYGETNDESKSCSQYGYGRLGASTFAGYSGTVFDPGEGGANGSYKGDLARVYFYMATRYRTTNFTSGTGGTSFTYSNGVADLTDYMKNLMLKWHREDPVSEKELIRNNAIYAHQKNRNPFVDYPCLVEYIWGEHKGESVDLSALVSGYEGVGTDCCSGGGSGSGEEELPTYMAPPAGYYNVIEGLQDSLLKSRLGELSNTGTRLSYGSGSTNRTWYGFYFTDRDTTDNSVIDMYSNTKRYFSTTSTTASVSGCEIEHMLPKSWWGGEDNDAYKDLYHLVPSDGSANSSKSNWGPGVPDMTYSTAFDNGRFYTSRDVIHGLTRCFAPSDEFKGDFARAYFYVVTTYGDQFTWVQSAIDAGMTNDSYLEFQDWLAELLMEWHRSDPVSEKEIRRAYEVNKIQGNRNPFIDYPCLAEYIWGNRKGEAVHMSELVSGYEGKGTDCCGSSEIPATKYAITWSKNGVTSTMQVEEGSRPTPPSVADCSTTRVFVGWTTSSNYSGNGSDLMTAQADFPAASSNATYYAVFADASTTGSGTGTGTASFSPSDLQGQGTSGTGSAIEATKNGVTFRCDKGYGDASAVRCYKNGIVTISSSNTIKAITFTFSGSYTGDLSTSYENLSTNEWSQTLGSQARFTSIVVTYSGGVTSYSNYGTLCEACVPEAPEVSFASGEKSTTCGGAVSNALSKGGSEGAVTYTSSNTDVATVNASTGAVTIYGAGATTITANVAAAGCYTAAQASYTLTVNRINAAVEFETPTTVLREGESIVNGAQTTSDATITYTSSNTAVATVNDEGEVTAVAPGTARITASVAQTDCFTAESAYYDLTVTAIPTYTVTWKANGVIVETTENVKEGEFYSLPDNPENCSEERVFVGWTVEKNYESETTAPANLITSVFAVPFLTSDTTLYAVYADKKTTSTEVEITDSLTRAFTGVTSTSYTEWKDKEGTSGAVYAGNTAGGNSSIQLRSSNNNEGLFTTVSGGTLKRIALSWNSSTNTSRVINVYGKNTPYSSAADLFSEDAATQGTLLGTIKCSANAPLTINGTYAYVGIRSASAAIYLDSIAITWSTTGSSTETTYSNYSTECEKEEFDFKALAATDVTYNAFTANWTEAGVTYYKLDVMEAVETTEAQITTFYTKDFTESIDGWDIENVSGYEYVWTHSSKYGAYASTYIKGSDNNYTRYAAESWLISPSIDLTDAMSATLTLNHVFRYDNRVYLMITENEGDTWTQLSPSNWTKANDWTFVNSQVDLAAYLGKTIHVGCKYVSDTEANATWEVKSITISGMAELPLITHESITGYPTYVTGTSALVSGLNSETTYYYTVQPLGGTKSDEIEVTTLKYTTPTELETVQGQNVARKVLIDGKMYILIGEHCYDVTGKRIR